MIEVEGPDGTIYEVDTDDEAVARETVRKHLAKAAPPAPKQPSWLDQARAFAAGATDTASSGFIDEAAGNAAAASQIVRESQRAASQGGVPGAILQGIRGGAAPVEAFVRGLTGSDTEAMRQAREGRTQAVRDDQEALKAQSPGFYTGGQITGGVAQAIVPVGRAAQGARALQRAGAAAGAGATFGGLYGLGSGKSAEERLTGGASGAAVGGIIGGAASPIADAIGASPLAGRVQEAVGDALPALGRTLRGMTNPANVNRGVGMTIGPPPMGSGAGAGSRSARSSGDSIARRLAQLADRNRMGADELPARIQKMQADPRGQIVAEAFGEPGIMSAATVARMPGQTGSLATEKMIERNAQQATRLGKDLTGQTAEAATDFLANKVRVTSQQYLSPVFSRPYDPVTRKGAETAWQMLSQRESIKAALPAARNQIKELIQRGEAPAGALTDPAYLAHYAKMQLQKQIKDPSLIRTSAQQVDNGNLIAASKELRAFVEQIRPGYAQAMEELQKVIIPRSLADLIENARGVDPNIARQLRGNHEVRRALEREFMGTFGEALKTEDQLYRNATRMFPSSGSQTTPLALGALDEMAAGGAALPTTKQGALAWIADRVSAPIQESRRNELGQTLFSDVSQIDPAQLARIQAELRRITELRAARARGAAAAGGAAGSTASNRTR